MIEIEWGTPEGVEALNHSEALQLVQRQAAQRPTPRYQQDRQVETKPETRLDTAILAMAQDLSIAGPTEPPAPSLALLARQHERMQRFPTLMDAIHAALGRPRDPATTELEPRADTATVLKDTLFKAFVPWKNPAPIHVKQQTQPQPAVLMSVDNPAGWKLEDLLERVRVELMAKNAKLAASAGHGVDPAEMRRTMVRTTVRELNERLVALVMQAIYIQQDVMAELKKLGPDQGPLGKPRV